MKTLQQIFDLMIEKGCYNRSRYRDIESFFDQSRFMCLAINYHGRYMLTDAEVKKALNAIDNYLYTVLERDSEHCTLYAALQMCGYKHDDDALMAVYQNWAKRPNLRIQRNL